MTERSVAHRRWPKREAAVQEFVAGNASHRVSAKKIEEVNRNVKRRSVADAPPLVVIDDFDCGGDEEASRAVKRSKVERATSSMDESADKMEEMKEKNEKREAEIDEEIEVDPDERWEPPAAGAITQYVTKPAWDWVVVSRRAGNKLKALQPLPSSRPRAEVLMVKPLQQVAPELDEDDGEEDLEDELFRDMPTNNNEADVSEDEARSMVCDTIKKFEKLRLKIMQDAPDPNKPGDCASAAGRIMNERNAWVNRVKRIGPVPGVEIGDVFYFRVAMCVIGLHQQTQAGISYILAQHSPTKDAVAVSLVLSGGYEDDKDDGDSFIYTGHGGQILGSRRQSEDQKLVRGNMALANSCKHDIPVRVVRGYPDSNSPTGKMYGYDGLYHVVEYWPETGVSGFKVFKYRLERLPGQRERGSKIVKFSGKLKSKQLTREGVVCDDLSNGKERVPICVVNEVDDPPVLPPPFHYIGKVIMPPTYLAPAVPSGCRCRGPCGDREQCRCIRRNGGHLPYFSDGTIKDWKSIVYECGPQCGCPPTCPNRVSQKGQFRKLEVFKTENRGWGVRSWESIPFGSFICEYVGEMIDNDEAERRVGQDEYIFDIDCINGNRSRGVDISSFVETTTDGELCERIEGNFSIDAQTSGNVSRFINHSCDPNIFVQCVFYDHYDLVSPHIMMFASRNIKPFEELCYDYAYTLNSVHDASGQVKKKACYCGSRKCRKRLY